MQDWVLIKTDDGTTVPLWVHAAEEPARYVLLLSPALGIPARFYKKLATALAVNCITTLCLEQRGNGESPYRPGDGSTFGLRAYLEQDLPAAVGYIEEQFLQGQNPPELIMAGHSLGGHLTGLYAVLNPEKVSKIIRLACGFPYYGDFKGRASFFVRLLVWLLPAMTRLLGYFPGSRLGFGGREYRNLMLDWRVWARDGRYIIDGMDGLEDKLRQFKGRVLSIAFQRDDLSSDAATNRGLGYFEKAEITRVTLGEKEQGTYLGHINWARSPKGAVAEIVKWLG